MLPKGYGKIVTIASMVSFFGGQTVPVYSAAKGGIAQMTKEMSNDWIGRGINVDSLAPGYMATEMNEALLDKSNPRYAQITERIPAHRWGDGNDMKGPCLFLCSHASDYVGGAIIPVDGGYTGQIINYPVRPLKKNGLLHERMYSHGAGIFYEDYRLKNMVISR